MNEKSKSKTWTVTRVWEVNDRMVVAPTIEDAIAVYHDATDGAEIRMVKARDTYGGDFDAIIRKGVSV